MAENNQSFFLSLDIKEFTENALKAKGSIQNIGDSENLTGLVDGLLRASAGIAALGVAAFALKSTFDLVFEAEQIKRTNNLFDEMAKSIGVAGDKFKEDLVGATKGLADDTDIINAANKAIVTMGESAKRLPEVMDLARRLTLNFGGDIIERFEQINYAIASGSNKMLKANGIIIDAQKAIKDYARSLGVSADSLTEAGRKQAVMNAALEFGQKKIKDVAGAENDAITTSQQLKVAIKDIGETFVLAFEKVAGPPVRAFFKMMADEAKEIKLLLGGALDSEDAPTRYAARLQLINTQLAQMKDELKNVESNSGVWAKMLNWIGGAGSAAGKLKEDIAELEKQQAYFSSALESTKQKSTEAIKNESAANKEALVDQQKVNEERMKFENEILHLKQENAKHAIETAQNTTQLENAEEELRLTYAQERYNKLQQLQEDYEQKHLMTHAQYLEMQRQVDEQFLQNLQQLEDEHEKNREKMDDNYLRHSQNTFDGISRAAQVSANAAQRDLQNFGKQGMMVMDTLKKRGADAFEAFGRAAIDHSMSASQIMKGFFLNSLADIAQAQGQLYLAMGFVDPTKLAAGAALLALSGALRAMAGSAGAGGGIGDVGGGGAGVGSSYSSPSDNQPQQTAEQKKSVTVQVQGNYFETEQTKTKLMDMIREATDATDFKYVQIAGQ